ncbi:hypothetical protein AB0G79_08085 [Streptomyces sp. NPDC020807]|uniref:hypothetical protein n=1 Tax=Streptomyces sp. NPDC020807 TaxID=3155119 RepID=UPI0033F0CE55
MGWTVLYIAFGVVALWLLGEVLLQYKARLRWRLLAFTGFLGVVLGVLLPSVAVIIAGAVGFAVGQTYVTLSFRRGFSTGWAIGGNPGESRRRKDAPAEAGPTLEVTGLSYGSEETPGETTAVYEPQPMPDETGQYGIYDIAQNQGQGQGQDDQARAQGQAQYQDQDQGQYQGQGHQYQEQAQYQDQSQYQGQGYDTYAPAYEQQGHEYQQYAYQPEFQQSDYPQAGYQQPDHQQAGYAQTGYEQQQYAAYSDPYIGGPNTDGQQQYAAPYYGDTYAPSYTYDTPPGGVWVPQQRDTEPAPQQPHPDEQQQYRY